MTTTNKVLVIIFSTLLVGVLAFLTFWGINNYNKVQDALSGANIYTEIDLDKAYQDGYDTALENKEEYDDLINGYRDTITTQTDSISQLNSRITSLTNDNRDYESRIVVLTTDKNNLQTQYDNLVIVNSTNETTIEDINSDLATLQADFDRITNENNLNLSTITELNEDIAELESNIAILQSSCDDKTEEIADLNLQLSNKQAELTIMTNNYNNGVSQIASLNTYITSLQTLNTQLQNTNNQNNVIITGLNTQITNMNTEISELNIRIINNSTATSVYTNRITELENSVAYYENYIAGLESGTQVVATFEFNGSVVAIQIVNKNTTVSITNPVSTERVIFNYWTVDDVQVDLSNYTVSANTKFVADFTQKYSVTFVSNDETVSTQYVVGNAYATTPSAPLKANFEFDGWSIDGVNVIDISSNAITQNTTFYAVFTQLVNVNFVYESDTISTQTIRVGEYAENVTAENTAYKIFNGWKVNGSVVDVSTYLINSATVFTADITYKYDVTFMVDNVEYNSQVVTSNSYATIPTAPTSEGYVFTGWSIDGANVMNVSSYSITQNTIFYAVIEYKKEVIFMVDDVEYNSQLVALNSYATKPISPIKDNYIFNGWSIDGENIINISTYSIFENITFISLFTYDNSGFFDAVGNKLYSWQELRDNNFIYVYYPSILTKGSNINSLPNGSLVIQNSIKTIDASAFSSCSKLISVIIPNSVTSIGKHAFSSCSNLTSITISNSVVSIGCCAFSYCSSLSSIYIPTSVLTISADTLNGSPFYGCSSNLIIYCGASSKRSGWQTYYNYRAPSESSTPRLTVNFGYTYEQYLTAYEEVEEELIAGLYDEGGFLISSWEDLISNEIFNLEDGSLYCTSNTSSTVGYSLILPDSISVIGTGCFASTLFSKIYIPNSVIRISNDAFINCSNLENLYIPNSILTIDGHPFIYCSELTIFTEFEQQQAGWNATFNKVAWSPETFATVNYSFTYEQYLIAIGE